jgi:hypothetical protein
MSTKVLEHRLSTGVTTQNNSSLFKETQKTLATHNRPSKLSEHSVIICGFGPACPS